MQRAENEDANAEQDTEERLAGDGRCAVAVLGFKFNEALVDGPADNQRDERASSTSNHTSGTGRKYHPLTVARCDMKQIKDIAAPERLAPVRWVFV